MKVSIVTVCRNAEATIGEAVASVAEQRDVELEHVVVDGASTDRTVEVAAAAIREGGTLLSEPDKSLYDAMNKGIALATGDVIGILNADDRMAGPGVVADVARAFERHGTDAILGDIAFTAPGDDGRIVRRYDSGRFRPGLLRWGWMPAHPGMYLTRDAYDRVGPYRIDYRIASDFEFVVRAFGIEGLSYTHLPEILVHMRPGGVSTDGLNARRTINREVKRALRENGYRTNDLMIASKYPLKIVEWLRRR